MTENQIEPRPYIGGSDTRRFVYILRGLLCDVIGIGAPRAPRGAPIPMTSLLRLATWAGPAAAQVGPAAARAGTGSGSGWTGSGSDWTNSGSGWTSSGSGWTGSGSGWTGMDRKRLGLDSS